jgi:hypothetical protein
MVHSAVRTIHVVVRPSRPPSSSVPSTRCTLAAAPRAAARCSSSSSPAPATAPPRSPWPCTPAGAARRASSSAPSSPSGTSRRREKSSTPRPASARSRCAPGRACTGGTRSGCSSPSTRSPEGRSIRANDGVEFKGVRWSSKASRAGVESEGWAERRAGQSP